MLWDYVGLVFLNLESAQLVSGCTPLEDAVNPSMGACFGILPQTLQEEYTHSQV